MMINEERIVATIDKATKALSEFSGSSSAKKKETVLTGMVSSLLTLVSELFNSIKNISTKNEEGSALASTVNDKVRGLEDKVDVNKQRSMKGNFIVSSMAREGKVCLIKTEKQLKDENVSLEHHIIELVKDKYEVDLPVDDIEACHRLPNGSVVLRLWNKRAGSAYADMVKAIKLGKNLEMNVYFNFQLTRRRSNLMYEIRKLKREQKIFKYYVNENGDMFIVINEGDTKKRITFGETERQNFRTLTKEELLHLVEQ